jgi:hypothetical protein
MNGEKLQVNDEIAGHRIEVILPILVIDHPYLIKHMATSFP